MADPPRDPDEIALLRALADLTDGDHITLVELCAVASAAAGQRVEWFYAHQAIADLHTRGCVTRIVVQRSGHPRQQAYALNARGRVRVARLLGDR